MRRRPDRRDRRAALAVLCAACLAVTTGYTLMATRRGAPLAAPEAPMTDAAAAPTLSALPSGPHVLFRSTAMDTGFGRVAVAPLDASEHRRAFTALECERVDFAGGQGMCLAARRGFATTYQAYSFGSDLRRRHEFPLSGIPSRTRVSPDGRVAAVTVFVSGHSYAQGGFSTQTTFFDLRNGATLSEMEEFTVVRGGERFTSPDFNFWGVTFAADGNRFYATLASRGTSYLIEGDLRARMATVLRENVECPSLSPDGRRLVFKKRVDDRAGPVSWRLHLLDLAGGAESPLTEDRNVDDQVEWLDNQHILYGLPEDASPPTASTTTWRLRVDTGDPPRPLLRGAWSPAVIG